MPSHFPIRVGTLYHFTLLLIHFRCTPSVTNSCENTTAESILHNVMLMITRGLVDFPAGNCVTKYTSTALMTLRSLQKLIPVNFTHQLMSIPSATDRKSTVQNLKRHLTALWKSMTFHPEVRLTTLVTCSFT